MKVIFVVSALHGGGAERVIATLANTFSRCKDKVIILMIAGNEQAYEIEADVEVISLGGASHGKLTARVKRLFFMRRFFKEHSNYRIVSFSTTINIFTILASLGLGMKVIVSERNDPNQCNFKRLRNFVYGFGSGFVFQTEDAKKCFSKRIQSKSCVIPNPLRKNLPECFTEDKILKNEITEEARKKREKKIAAVGRLEQQKNHLLLLQAFAGFHEHYPEYELHIFGQGCLEDFLKNKAEIMGIRDKVVFEGFCSDVLEKIRSYSMYVLSSDYEGISNSLMEAMALGLPCISTDCPIGGSAMCIQNGVNGLLVPVGEKEALQRAMEKVAADQKAASEMGKKASEIREIFAEEKIAEMWKKYIEALYLELNGKR